MTFCISPLVALDELQSSKALVSKKIPAIASIISSNLFPTAVLAVFTARARPEQPKGLRRHRRRREQSKY